MPTRGTLTASLATVLLAGGLGACGGSGSGGTGTTSTRTPRITAVSFTFRDGVITPATASLSVVTPMLDLGIVSADGRPHAVVVRFGADRVRIVVAPGETATRTVAAKPGRYRIVPDGATEPALLILK